MRGRQALNNVSSWQAVAADKRREAPKAAERLNREADQIEEMIRRVSCVQCEVLIDIPHAGQYSKAWPTHELGCPYA